MTMHTNSLEAYDHITAIGSKETRLEDILEVFQSGRAYTDRQAHQKLFPGSDDMNKTRPRISEGIAKGLLEEIGKTRDEETGRPVRVVMLKPQHKKPAQESLF